MAPMDINPRSSSPDKKFDLSDDEIDLAFSIYFTWGYPDFVREAFRVLEAVSENPIDPNKNLSWRELRLALEEADSPRIRYMVAGNPSTRNNVLNFLAKQPDATVARRVAENPNVHGSTLVFLARHEVATVRLAVAENATAPECVLLTLARDEDADIRYAMAENHNSPLSVLEVLSADENPFVSVRADQTLRSLTPTEVVRPDFSRVARRRIGRAAM